MVSCAYCRASCKPTIHSPKQEWPYRSSRRLWQRRSRRETANTRRRTANRDEGSTPRHAEGGCTDLRDGCVSGMAPGGNPSCERRVRGSGVRQPIRTRASVCRSQSRAERRRRTVRRQQWSSVVCRVSPTQDAGSASATHGIAMIAEVPDPPRFRVGGCQESPRLGALNRSGGTPRFSTQYDDF
jgi:hypothetical protein